MKINTRISSSGFIELKIDEIETVIFKKDIDELNLTILNLREIIEELEDFLEN